jgi:predicted ATP-dependent serine protease
MEIKPAHIIIAGMAGVHGIGKSMIHLHHIHQLIEKGEVVVINSEMGMEQLKKRVEDMAPREFLLKPTPIDDYIPLKPHLENRDFIGGGKKLPKKNKRR